jgi:4-hydroxybenzoate polyprenyltransferase
MIKTVLHTSRPHFWLYEAGTFLLGYLTGCVLYGSFIWSWLLPFFFLYFLVPANLLIYGVNDVYDYETDILNPRKNGIEDALSKDLHKPILWWSFWLTLPFSVVVAFQETAVIIAFLAFLIGAIYYSAPPIRAKAKPVLDSCFSSLHYTATGVFGYLLVAPVDTIAWPLVIAGFFWAVAMHAYSAIPDIEADTEAGLATIASWAGANRTILLCSMLYASSFYVLSVYTEPVFSLFALPYLLLMWQSLQVAGSTLVRVYHRFAYLNAVVGTALSIFLIYTLTL